MWKRNTISKIPLIVIDESDANMLKTLHTPQVVLKSAHERYVNLGNVLKLLEDYQQLKRDANEENWLDIEKSKLEHIKLIELNLKRDLSIFPMKGGSEEEQPQQYKKILYYILMVLGTINDAARSYMFGCALISLIPSLSQTIRIILSILYIVFEAILFYGFEISFLRDALGISNKSTHYVSYTNTNIEQVRIVTRINHLLANIQVLDMDAKLYQDYQSLVTVLNTDLQTKFYSLQSYEEPFSKKILKMAILGFGMITNIASSYFMLNTLLKAWAATMVGTPLGWGIIILAILVDLGFYYAMGGASILRLLNSGQDNFNVLKNELSLFEQEHLLFFSKRINKKEVKLSHIIVRDMATQTQSSMN